MPATPRMAVPRQPTTLTLPFPSPSSPRRAGSSDPKRGGGGSCECDVVSAIVLPVDTNRGGGPGCPALVLMSRDPSCQFNEAARLRPDKRRRESSRAPAEMSPGGWHTGRRKDHGWRAGPLRAEPGGPCANPFPDWHATSGPGGRITQAPSIGKRHTKPPTHGPKRSLVPTGETTSRLETCHPSLCVGSSLSHSRPGRVARGVHWNTFGGPRWVRSVS